MTRLFLAEQSALAPGGHYYAYTRVVAEAALRAGLDVTILENKRFRGDWGLPDAAVVPAFHHTWGEAEHMWVRDFKPGHIAYDFETATQAQPPGAGDHVLFATLSAAEMRAFLDMLVELPPDDHPTYHLLLRYDPEGVRGSLEHFKPLFDRVARSALLRRILRMHTDTEQLTAAYAELMGVPFHTLPIPFAQDRLRRRLGARSPAQAPFVVTYLGDARLEKNFAAIPDAVAQLDRDYLRTSRARFVLQSNFNTEGGEPGMLGAVQKLGQHPARRVELIAEPMSNDAYYDRLAEADIVLIPYDADRYRARSSGVLVEAMAAGKPVVTTRGSWMESQVSDAHAVLIDGPRDLARGLRKALDDFDRLDAGAKALQAQIMDWSSGDNFVRSLLASAAPAEPKVPPAEQARILVVVDGEALVLRNGAGVVAKTQLRYLCSAGYAVCVVVLKKGGEPPGSAGADQWLQAVRDRLAEFDLDGLFVAASGRLSFDTLAQQRRRTSKTESIAAEATKVASLDVSLELTSYLKRRPVTAVLLNYVPNLPLVENLGLGGVPVICETIDVQSFQKAIYGRRRVIQEDLDLETALLARCDHLVSISASETAFMRDALPDKPITTCGVFPDLPAVDARGLAGARNLMEVVAACRPTDARRASEPVGEPEVVQSLARLASLDRFDLVFVSSNHTSNVSGLQWFLDQVYLPALAPLGVTLAVAGSICDWGHWPVHDQLFLLGRLTRLEPLYQASAVAVLAVTEGAGAAVKTLDALAHGRPVVATAAALRGIEEADIGGVTQADTAEEMRRAVLDLLASPERLERQGRAALAWARRRASLARYAELMDGVFADVLGPRALTGPAPSPSGAAEPLNWSPFVRNCNRLIRSWLEEAPFEEDAVASLAEADPAEVERTVKSLLSSLLLTRDAYLPEADRGLLRQVAAHGRDEAERGARVILATLHVARATPLASAGPVEVTVLCEDSVPLEVVVEGGAVSGRLERTGQSTELTPKEGSRWRAAAASRAPRRGVAALSLAEAPRRVELRQVFRLDTSSRDDVDGAAPPSGAVGVGELTLSAGDETSLRVPGLASSPRGRRSVELAFRAEGLFYVEVRRAAEVLQGTRVRRDGLEVFAFPLDDSSAPVALEIASELGTCRLVEAVTRLVLGDDDDPATALAAGAQTIDAPSPDQDLIAQAHSAALRGTPVLRSQALLLKRWRSEGVELPPELVEVLEADATTLGAGEQVINASCGLTLEVHAIVDEDVDDAEFRCRVDGTLVPVAASHGRGRVWRLDGSRPGTRPTWRRRVRMSHDGDAGRRPTVLHAVYRHVAGCDRATGSAYLRRTNTYAPEIISADAGRVWTGPGRITRFTFPFGVTRPGGLVVSLGDLGENQAPGDVSLLLNGSPIPCVEETTPEGRQYSFAFAPDPAALAVTELRIETRRVSRTVGDGGARGVAINFIQFAFPL